MLISLRSFAYKNIIYACITKRHNLNTVILPENSQVTLTIYSGDLSENPIVLVNAVQKRGFYSVSFNSKGLPAGTYQAVLETSAGRQMDVITKKVGIASKDNNYNKE